MLTQEQLALGFVYKSDTSQHLWRILPADDLSGDCEDYALTALYIEAGGVLGMLYALVLGSAKILRCTLPSGGAHAVLRYKGRCIDNGDRKWVSQDLLESRGYDFHKRSFLFTTVLQQLFRTFVLTLIKKV